MKRFSYYGLWTIRLLACNRWLSKDGATVAILGFTFAFAVVWLILVIFWTQNLRLSSSPNGSISAHSLEQLVDSSAVDRARLKESLYFVLFCELLSLTFQYFYLFNKIYFVADKANEARWNAVRNTYATNTLKLIKHMSKKWQDWRVCLWQHNARCGLVAKIL